MAKSTKVKTEKVKPFVNNDTESGITIIEVIPEVIDEPQKETIEEWVEGTKKDLDERIAILAPNKPIAEEKTDQQKIIDYIANSHSEVVDLSPIIRSLYPLPTYAEPALYLRQSESKKIMGLIASMKANGDISLVDDRYLLLGKNHWVDGDTKTRHHNIDTVKILAIKK